MTTHRDHDQPAPAVESCGMRGVNGHQLAVVTHESSGDGVQTTVVFSHGFLGEATGPRRTFVRAARQLAERGISSVRFDQYGSGNSAGDFLESSFTDWCATTRALAQAELDRGRRVVLFGQSMGAAASIVVAAQLRAEPGLAALVAWVPDPNIDPLDLPAEAVVEEAGQLVTARYWLQAREADVGAHLRQVRCPAFIVQCTADDLVDDANRRAITDAARAHHIVDTWHDLPHSAWTHEQASEILQRSTDFIAATLGP